MMVTNVNAVFLPCPGYYNKSSNNKDSYKPNGKVWFFCNRVQSFLLETYDDCEYKTTGFQWGSCCSIF